MFTFLILNAGTIHFGLTGRFKLQKLVYEAAANASDSFLSLYLVEIMNVFGVCYVMLCYVMLCMYVCMYVCMHAFIYLFIYLGR
jgi:hypothetical protein